MPSTLTVALKEFSDIVKGRRFIVLVIVFGLLLTVAIASVYLTVMQNINIPGIAMPRGFLGRAAYTLITMMSYFAPIIGLALGFDAISGEKEKGTLKIVLAQPVYRDIVINGKFLAALLAASLAILIASIVNIGGVAFILGVTPTGEEVARLVLFMAFSILFAMTYYSIAVLLSTISKRTAQSMIIGVVLWAIFTFVIPIIASLVAFTIRPIRIGQNMTREEMQRFMEELRSRTAITETINSFTPNYHFSRIAYYILNVYTGAAIGPRNPIETRNISIMEGLTLAWPNILVLVLVTAIAFIASYTIFMRQEIR
ncbi:MAG: ABC transporter permease subunit [Candidatus Bathyarchaeia archaeon]